MTTQKNHPAAGQPDSFDRYPVYYGSDLELTYTPQRSVFTLWAPTADKVRLNLYASGEGGEPEERLETVSYTHLTLPTSELVYN